jgi:serine/threonine protein kinase
MLFDFIQTQSGVGPVCWMAPESIAYRNYSKKSDVWTFGIVGLCEFSQFSFHFISQFDVIFLFE